MTLAWSEHPAARAEFLGAAAWYEDQETGLGARFMSELGQGIRHIREWPNAAPAFRESARMSLVRSKSVSVFPYRIIYLVRADELVVIAYAHARRRPGFWRGRLSHL